MTIYSLEVIMLFAILGFLIVYFLFIKEKLNSSIPLTLQKIYLSIFTLLFILSTVLALLDIHHIITLTKANYLHFIFIIILSVFLALFCLWQSLRLHQRWPLFLLSVLALGAALLANIMHGIWADESGGSGGGFIYLSILGLSFIGCLVLALWPSNKPNTQASLYSSTNGLPNKSSPKVNSSS